MARTVKTFGVAVVTSESWSLDAHAIKADSMAKTEEALLKSSKQKKIGVMGGLVCRGRQQFHFHPFSPKKQASDWLAPQEANVNNNNSLEAPIRGLLFGGKLEENWRKEIAITLHHTKPQITLS